LLPSLCFPSYSSILVSDFSFCVAIVCGTGSPFACFYY
jgi:hypothetical protein